MQVSGFCRHFASSGIVSSSWRNLTTIPDKLEYLLINYIQLLRDDRIKIVYMAISCKLTFYRTHRLSFIFTNCMASFKSSDPL